MTIWDKAEPWFRGDPEIEVWLQAAQEGVYYAVPQGGGLQHALHFLSGTYIQTLSCAGRLAPEPKKRFDYNEENGHTYLQEVLIEKLTGFEREEIVEGIYGVILSRRRTEVKPPFIIRIIERDDGQECNVPPTLALYHTMGVGFKKTVGNSFYPIPNVPSLNDLMIALNITNENDLMGNFLFSDWGSFESLSSSSVFNGSHVTVQFLNRGITAQTIPAEINPYSP